MNSFHSFNLIRGLAALLVFAGHLRTLMFNEYSGNNNSIAAKLFYFVTGFGHQAVIVFFVLSGFFIAKTIDSSVANNRWSITNYSLERLLRLWTVLIPALLATLVLDLTGSSLFAQSDAYLGLVPHLADSNPTGRLGMDMFLGNMFFLQGIICGTYGSNSPLWSLSYEFWYYVVYPLLLFAVVYRTSTLRSIVLIGSALLCFYFIGSAISLYFIIWLGGAAAFHLYKRQYSGKSLLVLTIVSLPLTLLTLAMVRVGKLPSLFNDFSLGLFTSMLVLGLSNSDIKNRLLAKTADYLANISYTVYAFHLPTCIFITSLLFHQRFNWEARSFMAFIAVLLAVLGISISLWYLFERNTDRWKKVLKKQFGVNTNYSKK